MCVLHFESYDADNSSFYNIVKTIKELQQNAAYVFNEHLSTRFRTTESLSVTICICYYE